MGTEIADHRLTDLQASFVRFLAKGTDQVTAAARAGYASASAEEESYRLLRSPHIQLALHIEARRRIIRLSGMAISVLEKLARDATSEKVRADCANSILNRAGLIPPRAAADKSGAETPLHEMSVVELRRMADRLEGEIQARAKPVNAPPDASIDRAALDLIE